MKKISRWDKANKFAIIITISLGVVIPSCKYIFSESENINSEISIIDYNIPVEDNNGFIREKLEGIVLPNFDSNDLSRVIRDSLVSSFKVPSDFRFSYYLKIKECMPNYLDRYYLISKIDSVIKKESYNLKHTSHFVTTKIENRGEQIVNRLRFELPAKGYFEIYLNNSLIKNGHFTNNIEIGELRSSNTIILKIWSFNHISEYTNFLYTHDNGSICPTVLKQVKKGMFFWIYNNPYFFIFIILSGLLAITINILAWLPFIKERIEKSKNIVG